MITHAELVEARTRLLECAVSFFAAQPDVVGLFLAGSLPAGSADAYSDIDLRVIASPEGQARLVAGRLEWPSQWGDLLFNEWLEGTHHCVSHFRPFLKIDVFYWTPESFGPSPWFGLPATVLVDRDGLVERVLDQSRSMAFSPPSGDEVSRVLSKALAGAHEVVRRARRGQLFFAQSLLDELRSNLARLDRWARGRDVSSPEDVRSTGTLSVPVASAIERSYVGLDSADIDAALVGLGGVLSDLIPALHSRFALNRPLTRDLASIELVTRRQIG
jgi:hypothetical protein